MVVEGVDFCFRGTTLQESAAVVWSVCLVLPTENCAFSLSSLCKSVIRTLLSSRESCCVDVFVCSFSFFTMTLFY